MSQVFRENLMSFNRKERFLLLKQAIGSGFRLDQSFCDELTTGFGVPVKAESYFAIDYHLDWLYAAAFLASEPEPIGHTQNNEPIFALPTESGLLNATQEDIDFLIAFPDLHDDNVTHLLLLEAKGVTGWSNAQLTRKAKRLKAIFGDNGDRWCSEKSAIKPYFAILSPALPSDKFKVPSSPKWILTADNMVKHFCLKIPKKLWQPKRRDRVDGEPKRYKNWFVASSTPESTEKR